MLTIVYRIVIISLFSWKVLAVECPKDNSKVAEELLDLIISGHSLQGGSKCLTNKNYKFIHKILDPSNDGVETPVEILNSASEVKIEKIQMVNKTGLHTAFIKFGNENHTFDFVIHATPKKIKKYRCGNLLSVPQKLPVLKKCLNN